MLSKAGHTLVTASNGSKALDVLAQDRNFDLVILDIEMPELDGYATARAIREMEAKDKLTALPIIALTASARAEDEVLCRAAGMDGFLTKPIDMHKLHAALVAALAGSA